MASGGLALEVTVSTTLLGVQKMKSIPLPPQATQLLESLRSIGYSVEAAVADLIDNSITAGASLVEIRFPPGAPI